ncbi:hypothetical protein [Streptomyces sp. NPDC093514]|uniref:hypothetical protein n=1 Tax=Streptomyces sp. NPDC093514 TaxID=3366039 RepID=UPI0038161726
MSDHYQDVDTRAAATAEAALDALLARHQADLHSVLESALDTPTGLGRLGRPVLAVYQVGRIRHVTQVEPSSTWVGMSDVRGPASSALESAVDAIDEEVRQVEAFMEEIADHPNREVKPPGTRLKPLLALRIVYRELNRIANLLMDQEITKESVGSEFDLVESTLESQVSGWTDLVESTSGGQISTWGEKVTQGAAHASYADMLEQFIDRANATTLLRKMIVRLFEDADETVLQLN